jgi:hypothetical protein
VCFSLLDRLAAAGGQGKGRGGDRLCWLPGSRVADTHLCAPVEAAPGRGLQGTTEAASAIAPFLPAVGTCRRLPRRHTATSLGRTVCHLCKYIHTRLRTNLKSIEPIRFVLARFVSTCSTYFLSYNTVLSANRTY